MIKSRGIIARKKFIYVEKGATLPVDIGWVSGQSELNQRYDEDQLDIVE